MIAVLLHRRGSVKEVVADEVTIIRRCLASGRHSGKKTGAEARAPLPLPYAICCLS